MGEGWLESQSLDLNVCGTELYVIQGERPFPMELAPTQPDPLCLQGLHNTHTFHEGVITRVAYS